MDGLQFDWFEFSSFSASNLQPIFLFGQIQSSQIGGQSYSGPSLVLLVVQHKSRPSISAKIYSIGPWMLHCRASFAGSLFAWRTGFGASWTFQFARDFPSSRFQIRENSSGKKLIADLFLFSSPRQTLFPASRAWTKLLIGRLCPVFLKQIFAFLMMKVENFGLNLLINVQPVSNCLKTGKLKAA